MRSLYVGVDAHVDSCTLCALDDHGNRVLDVTVRTSTSDLVAVVKGLNGRVTLTLEQCGLTSWLAEELGDHVDTLILCDPRTNKLVTSGTKNDRVDAYKLATLLRNGSLKHVFQAKGHGKRLREFCWGYATMRKELVRTKNRLKSLFIAQGIPVAGDAVYEPEDCEAWVERLRGRPVRLRALAFYDMLATLEPRVVEAGREMVRAARKYPGWKSVRSVPGVGDIRAAMILGFVQTPTRFRSRRQLWAYCGLAVVTKSSSDYEVVGSSMVKRASTRTRGLNKNGNRALKHVFKNAALHAGRQGVFKDEFFRRIRRGQRPELVMLTFARRLATLAYTLWKRGETFDLKTYEKHQTQRASA